MQKAILDFNGCLCLQYGAVTDNKTDKVELHVWKASWRFSRSQ